MSSIIAALAASVLLFQTATAAPPSGAAPTDAARAVPQFHRPSAAELSDARTKLLQAVTESEQTLRKSPNGAVIAEEIGLENLKSLAQSDRLNIEALDAVYRRVSDGAAGREEEHILRLRAAVAQHAALLRSKTSDKAGKEFARQLRELRTARETYAATGSDSSLAAIRNVYEWLVKYDQAAELQKAVCRDLSHPNVCLWVDHRLMNSMVPPPKVEPVTINKSANGVFIRGQGEFTGNATISFRPDSTAATIEATIIGDGTNDVSASRGRATVFGDSSAHVNARQVFHFTAEGLTNDPPEITVDANYSPNSADFAAKRRLMRRLGGRIAMRAACKQRPQATEDMRQEVSREFEERLKKEVVAFVNKQNDIILEKYRLPMARWDMPCALAASTEKSTLRLTATLGKKSQLGAPRLPPVAECRENSLHGAIHDSAINNLQFTLAGKSIAEDEFQDLMFKTLGLQPTDGAPKRTREAARIKLAQDRPLSVAFAQGSARVTLRIAEFCGSGKETCGTIWTAKTRYVPRVTKSGVEVDRVEPISIEPEQGAITDALREVLSGFLVSKATSQGLTTTGELAKMAHLRVNSLNIRDGWLLVTMQPAPQAKTTNGAVSDLSASNK
jgi:hypothetical protein